MTPSGAATWLAGIPSWARAEVYTWTTANSGANCNALTALFLSVGWMLVRVSHRVAGPLYRFRQVFGQVTRGDLSVRVRVRDGDYLTRESEDFDAMIRAVRDRVRRAQTSAAAVRRDLAKLSATADRVSAKRLAELSAQAAETEDILGEFVTQADKADKRTSAEARVAKPARFGLTVTQVLLIVFITLYWIAALVGPAYTAALDRARAIGRGRPWKLAECVGEKSEHIRVGLARRTAKQRSKRARADRIDVVDVMELKLGALTHDL